MRVYMGFDRRAAAVAAAGLLALPAAQAELVLGNSNPNLAGRDAGYACCSGDSAPTESPLLVTSVAITGGSKLNFRVSGRVLNDPGVGPGSNPDSDQAWSMSNYGDGIVGALNVRLNSLVGVFLGASSPTGGATPAALDFAGGLGFASLAPAIGQIFFIGDGLTSDSNAGLFNGALQEFLVPTGATRLYLGTADGFGWFNNSGSFSVTPAIVGGAGPSPAPEPGTWALAGLALAGLLAARPRKA